MLGEGAIICVSWGYLHDDGEEGEDVESDRLGLPGPRFVAACMPPGVEAALLGDVGDVFSPFEDRAIVGDADFDFALESWEVST